jgi:lysophospholipase L1-like esterase
MKKILLLLSLLVAFFVSNAQYPVVQFLGRDSALVDSRGGLKARLINYAFTDTTEANTQRINQYPGAMIYTTTGDKLWLRNSIASLWVEVGTGGGGGISAVGAINGASKSVNGSVISGATIYFQTVDGTYPGLMTPAQKARLDSNSYLTIDKRYDSIAWRRNDSTFLVKSLRLQLNGSDITPTSTDSTLSWNIISSGSSNTFTQGLTESGGTVKLDNNRNIEYITQPTTGAALGSGWTAVGSPSYTVSGGKFVFTGGANNYTQYIRNDAGVLSEKATIEAYVIINTAGTTDQGVKIMWKSYNTHGYQHDIGAGYISGTSAGNTGKAVIHGPGGASANYSDSARTSSNGDTLYYQLTRDGLEFNIYIKNITKGWKLSKRIFATPMGIPFTAFNSAYVTVIPGAGSYTVYGLKYTINAPVITENYLVGNSITFGQAAASEAARYASLVGIPSLNIGSGGGADGTAEVLARVNEIIAIKPKRVLLMIGGNDVLFGVASATWKANYLAIRDSLVNNGIEVVHCLPTPRTATDLRDLKSYIDTSTTFRSDKVIDTWTPLLSGSYNLLTKYNYDNTHPNEAGMSQIAASINEALHYPNNSAFYVNKNLIAKNGYLFSNTTGTSFGNKMGAWIAAGENSSTKYMQGGYIDGIGGYIGSYSEGSSYDATMINPDGGNVGIGTNLSTPPSVLLHLKKSNFPAIRIEKTGTGSWYIGNRTESTGTDFKISYNTLDLLNITNAGALNIPYLTSGAGTKALRYNPATGDITYADTTSGGGGGGGVTSVATNTATGITGGTITTTGTLSIDTTLIATRAWRQKGIDSLAALIPGGGGSYINSQFASAQSARAWTTGIYRSDSSLQGRTTGASSGFKTGGLIAYGTSGTSSYLQFGYDGTLNTGWFQSVTEGSAYRDLIMNAAGGNLGLGNLSTAPSVLLHLKKTNYPAIRLEKTGTGSWYVGNPTEGTGNDFKITNGTTDAITATTAGAVSFPQITTGVGNKQMRVTSSTGAISYVDTIKTNSYTPTLTNTTNIAASTAYTTYYTVVGDMVTVWGTVDIDATAAATITEMGMSLPFAAGISQIYDLAGTAAFEDNTSVQIKGDNSNGRAMFRFTPQTNTNNKYSFQFTYKWVAP